MRTRTVPRRAALLPGVGAFGAAAFTPANLPNLVLWLKATDGVFQESTFITPSGDNDVVGGWRDQSGNGNDVIQVTSGKKPLLRLAEINGLPAIEFDGANDTIVNIVSDLGFSGTDKPLAIFAVMKVEDLSLSRTIFSIGNSAGTVRYYQFGTDVTPNYFTQRRDDASLIKTHTDGTPQTLNYVIATSLMDGTQSTMRIDGAVIGTPDTDLDVGVSTLDQFGVGSLKRSSEGNRWDGFLPELIVCQADLSAANVANVESYFSDRFGISIP